MKVSHDEGLASHVGSESCVVIREDTGEALTGESAGWVLSSEILNVRDADAVMSRGRQHRPLIIPRFMAYSAKSKDLASNGVKRSYQPKRRSRMLVPLT